jgi:hypothetical protein
VALAAIFVLSGCFYPARSCKERVVDPAPVAARALAAGEELHLSGQESLIVGRLVLTRDGEELADQGRRIARMNEKNEKAGILDKEVRSGGSYYLIVPPGRYYIDTFFPYAGFDVPTTPGIYYLGTLVVDLNYTYGGGTGGQVVDEYDAALTELGARNPRPAVVPQKRLLKVDRAIRGVLRVEKDCAWDMCYAGMSVSYCPL